MNDTEKSKRYHKVKKQLFFVGLFIDVVFFVVLFASGLSVYMRDRALEVSQNFIIVNGLYITVFLALYYIVHMPLRIFEGFTWEHRFNLSTQRFSKWLKDDIKRAGIGFVIVLILVEVVYLLIRRFPETWWIGAAIFWLFLTLVLAKITPQVIIPLFYKYTNISNPELKERILALFKKAKVGIKDAYAVDFSAKTKKANACVCGIGKNRRVILSDTLISRFLVSEIEAVVAHEIGHWRHHDIVKIAVVNSLVILAGFYCIDLLSNRALAFFGFSGLYDIAFFPMVALAFLLFGFVTTPFLNVFSRYLETKADGFCLELTQSPDDFISMMKKLGDTNLAEFQPGFLTEMFFCDHPPLIKRIRFAERFPSFRHKQ